MPRKFSLKEHIRPSIAASQVPSRRSRVRSGKMPSEAQGASDQWNNNFGLMARRRMVFSHDVSGNPVSCRTVTPTGWMGGAPDRKGRKVGPAQPLQTYVPDTEPQ